MSLLPQLFSLLIRDALHAETAAAEVGFGDEPTSTQSAKQEVERGGFAGEGHTVPYGTAPRPPCTVLELQCHPKDSVGWRLVLRYQFPTLFKGLSRCLHKPGIPSDPGFILTLANSE